MILGIISIILWVATIVGFVVNNNLKKLERQEDIIRQQQQQLQDIYAVIAESDRLIVEIDKRGTFSSDDEIGFFFQTVKGIQQTLNEFRPR
jgi:fructose-1,6-bisphosphatase